MNVRASGDLDYACARIGARYGARPDAATWRRIETVRDLGAMLDAARASALRPWTAGLAGDSDPHSLERVLRVQWRALAAEVAAWMPEPGDERLRAGRRDRGRLPALDHLRRGGGNPALARDDRVYEEWSDRARDDTSAAADTIAALAAAPDTDTLMHWWRDGWRRRLPRSYSREAPLLSTFVRLTLGHAADMRAAPPGDASPLVQALRERLEALYRRAVLEPTVAFVYLALAALDLARFRGEVMRRAVFPTLPPAT